MQHRATPAKGLLGNGVHKCAMKHRPPNGAQVGQRGEACHARIGPISAMQGIFNWGVDEDEEEGGRREEEEGPLWDQNRCKDVWLGGMTVCVCASLE